MNEQHTGRLVADHFPTHRSQRGDMERASTANDEHTLRRPALIVPERLHRRHPTTGRPYEEGSVALTERVLQLGHNPQVGRYEAARLHMSHYYDMEGWRTMAVRLRPIVRQSFLLALNQPTFLRVISAPSPR